MLQPGWHYISKNSFFIADFWSCATFRDGCISAGRHGGEDLYIDWNGNVISCIFSPCYLQNIREVSAEGGDLNTVLHSPFFSRIREWVDGYVCDLPANQIENLLAPCAPTGTAMK